MSKERLLSGLNKPVLVDREKNVDNAGIKKIKENFNEFRDKCLKPKIKEIRKNPYEIEKKKNLSTLKIKNIEKNLFKLQKSLSKLKKYYDNDDIEYKGIREVRNLFNQSIDEDYCKTIKKLVLLTIKVITQNMKSKGDKDKILSVKEAI